MRFGKEDFKEKLPSHELLKYIELAQKGDKKAYEIAVEHNLRLVANFILEHYNSVDEETKIDFFSVGCLYLCIAIQNFDVLSGNQFSTYAIPLINGEIKKYIRNNYHIYIPYPLNEIYSKMKKLKQANPNNEFDFKKIAKILNVSEFDVIDAINAYQNIVSIYSPITINNKNEKYNNKEEKYKILDYIPAYNSIVEKDIEEREKIKDLMDAINKLEPREQTVILFSFGINCEKASQIEIGKMLNISQPHTSRLLKKSLIKLKNLLPEYLKEDYGSTITFTPKKEKENVETIYSFFSAYSREAVDKTLKTFDEEERNLILIKYPYNEKDYNPKSISIYSKQNNIDYAKLYYKIDRLVKKLNKQLINKAINFNKKTIYSFFDLYSQEDIDNALEQFTEEERKLILIKYPYNEEDYNPKSIAIYAKQNNIDYAKLYYKIDRLVKNLNKKLINENFISNNKTKKL